MFDTVKDAWEMRCPSCKQDDQIDVSIQAWARLVPDGTDRDEAHSTQEEWNDRAICQACGFDGNLQAFKT